MNIENPTIMIIRLAGSIGRRHVLSRLLPRFPLALVVEAPDDDKECNGNWYRGKEGGVPAIVGDYYAAGQKADHRAGCKHRRYHALPYRDLFPRELVAYYAKRNNEHG